MRHTSYLAILTLLLCALLVPRPAGAKAASGVRLDQIGFNQKLNHAVPLATSFHDEGNKPTPLCSIVSDRPTILVLTYFECPRLCTLVLNGLVDSLRQVPLRPGRDYEVMAVSIDPHEGPELAAAKKVAYLQRYGDPSAKGWHFLTGGEPAIRQLADAVGFRYAYDTEQKQYAHVAGLVLLTPEGTISRYFFGLEFPSQDLRLALLQAGQGRIGSPVDQILLRCYHYDPITGKYSLAILRLVRAFGVGMALLLGAIILRYLRRDRRASPPAPLPVSTARPE